MRNVFRQLRIPVLLPVSMVIMIGRVNPSPATADSDSPLLVGAAVVDVSPDQLPVLVNGGFLSRSADQIKTRVNARAIVIDDGDSRDGDSRDGDSRDGDSRDGDGDSGDGDGDSSDDKRNHNALAIVVVDSCMLPKILIDDARASAFAATGIRPERIMISATHTHTAPSAFAALGTDVDLSYVPLLKRKVVEAIVAAQANARPARVGWGSVDAGDFTAVRRWIRRPDRLDTDPFGNPTVRANMHAAQNKDDVTGPSGPEDPELSMISFESPDGDPIAVLANFSMHYFGDAPVSADYFGLFCEGMQSHMRGTVAKKGRPDVVAVLSHGCSGDVWRRDYFTYDGHDPGSIQSYTQALLSIARDLYDSIEVADLPASSIAMAKTDIPMRYRVPDQQRLQWAQRIVDEVEDRAPSSKVEVYAREQILLDQMQSTSVSLQAIGIGDIGIATSPCETYALSGIKIKAQSPFKHTMVIELAGGADGYIPPPEQHDLGGYNTWAARSAGLETTAEPKIVASALELLERISGKPRRQAEPSVGPAAEAILARKPTAYWRFSEMEAPIAADQSGNNNDGVFERGVVFFLEGPEDPGGTAAGFAADGDVNRCAHFAGGRMRARLDSVGEAFTVSMSFWNGMPSEGRATTGWLFSRDYPYAISSAGQHVGIGGTATRPGRLIFQHGHAEPVVGTTEIPRWQWNRIRIVRTPTRMQVFLNDATNPEIDVPMASTDVKVDSWFIGGRSDNDSNFEGRIDEVAVLP